MTLRYLIASTSGLILISVALAQDHGHEKHNEKERVEKGSESHSHKDEHEHKEGDEHGEEHGHGEEGEEGGKNVGPDKGILELNEDLGFKLSPEAEKNFEIQYLDVGASTITLIKSAIVFTGEEKNIYRYRDGFYRRLDLDSIQRKGDSYIVSSKELKTGDKIVNHGLGLLRLAEIAAAGGGIEGHHH